MDTLALVTLQLYDLTVFRMVNHCSIAGEVLKKIMKN
jgi:hypothetical protein